jgi:hypothetical protein
VSVHLMDDQGQTNVWARVSQLKCARVWLEYVLFYWGGGGEWFSHLMFSVAHRVPLEYSKPSYLCIVKNLILFYICCFLYWQVFVSQNSFSC